MPYCKKHDEFYGIYCNGCFNEGRDKPQSPSLSPPLAEEDDDMWHPQDYSGRNAPQSTEEMETPLRWIKASERLPTDRDKKAARQNGNYLTLRVIEGELVKVGSFTCHSLQILEEWFPGIEWLDESPPLTSETDQPVPEEADKYIEAMAVECAHNVYEYKKNAGLLGNGYLFSDMIQAARGTAEAMYKRDQATIADLQSRLSQIITACQPVKDDFLVGHILKLAEGKKEGKA